MKLNGWQSWKAAVYLETDLDDWPANHRRDRCPFSTPQQRRNNLGIILRVAVHENDDVTFRVRQTRRDGGGLTKITFEAHHPERGLSLVQTCEHGKRSIAAAIIDNHNLVRLP